MSRKILSILVLLPKSNQTSFRNLPSILTSNFLLIFVIFRNEERETIFLHQKAISWLLSTAVQTRRRVLIRESRFFDSRLLSVTRFGKSQQVYTIIRGTDILP